MTRVVKFLFLLAIAGCVVTFARADSSAPQSYDPVIRVQLDRFFAGTTTVFLSSDAPFTVKDAQGNLVFSGNAGEVCQAGVSGSSGVAVSSCAQNEGEGSQLLRNAEGGIIISTGAAVTVKIALPGDSPVWHRYRGEISLCTAGGRLRITNDVPLEEYLCGVLKPEIGASAPVEALKAQAVAARTYAIRNLGRLNDQGADLDDTTRTQSYLGADGETPAICQAVQDTGGLVMTFDGKPIEAVYSTDCGGETAPGPASEPYLQPVSDPDCAQKSAWTKTYTRDQLDAALQGLLGQSIDKIASLSIETTDSSGRAAVIEITGANGQTKEVTGAALRETLGTDSLRSTLFTVTQAPDGSFTFSGHGWGHGMGMCQQGAIAMASDSPAATYDEILKHYYTGIGIAPLTPALVAAAGAHRLTAQAHAVSSNTVLSGGRS